MTHTPPRILVIDPDLDAIELARFALWRSGMPCIFQWFDDAALANASLLTQALCHSRELPALIMLDPRGFAGSEGYALLRTLCGYQVLADIPLVLFTSAPVSSDFCADQDSRIWYASKDQDPLLYMETLSRCVQARLTENVL